MTEEKVYCGRGCDCLCQCGDVYAHQGVPKSKWPPRRPEQEPEEEKDDWKEEGVRHLQMAFLGIMGTIQPLFEKHRQLLLDKCADPQERADRAKFLDDLKAQVQKH